MYGSRSDDDEPDGDAGSQAPAEDTTDEHADLPESDNAVTQPIDRVVDDVPGDDLYIPSRLPAATAQQVAAYVAEIGTVIDESMLLRPYVRTGGRTRADTYLAIEALVVASGAENTNGVPEHRHVQEICAEPRSVAEVAAYTRLPIGSARVIIADMLGLGLLSQCSNGVQAGSPPMELMERVRDGLRNL